MRTRRVLLLFLLVGSAGCNPLWDIGGRPGWEDEENSSRRRPLPREIGEDQVWVETELFRIASDQESFFKAVLSYCDDRRDPTARWQENGLRVCQGRPNFRASLQSAHRKSRTVQKTTYGLMVRSGSAGKIMFQELKPRGRVDLWVSGRVISTQEWINVMGGLEARPVVLPGDEVELTLTPLIHYYDAGASREIKLLELATVVRVPRESSLVISSMESREHNFGGTFLSAQARDRAEKILCVLTVW